MTLPLASNLINLLFLVLYVPKISPSLLALCQIGLMSLILRLSNLRLFNLFVVEANSREVIIILLRKLS